MTNEAPPQRIPERVLRFLKERLLLSAAVDLPPSAPSLPQSRQYQASTIHHPTSTILHYLLSTYPHSATTTTKPPPTPPPPTPPHPTMSPPTPTHPLITYTCTHTSRPSHPLPLPLSLTPLSTATLPAHTTISLPHPCSACHLTLLRTRLNNIARVHDPAIADLQKKIERVRKEPAIWNGGNPELMRGYMRAHETLRGLLEARNREQEGVTREWVGVWGEWKRGEGGVVG